MKPKNLKFFWSGGVLLSLFFLFTFLESVRIFQNIDYFTALYLQSLVPRVFDVPLSLLSVLGNFEFMAVTLAVLSFWLYKTTKKIPYSFIFLFGMILFVELLGKTFLYHPNPPDSLVRYTFPFDVPRVSVHTNYSFPSGHVSRTIFICIMAFFAYVKVGFNRTRQNIFKLFLILLTFLMVVSRVYLGEHWLSDVLGGLLLGGAMGLFALLYY